MMSAGALVDAGPLDKVEALSVAGAVGVAAGVSIVFAALWLWMSRRFARALIYATILANVLVYLVLAGLWAYMALVIVKNDNNNDNSSLVYGAVVFAIIGLLHLCLFFLWRRRIPFAAALLSTVAQVTQQYGGTIFASFFSLVFVLAWAALWSYSVFVNMTWIQASVNSGGSAAAYAVYVYLLFSFYWTQQVLQNTIFVTISGTFASWYFLGGNVAAMPRNPTGQSAKRALTTSFGSICLGSLLVAVLQTIRAILRGMRTKRNAILICFINCILACIERLVQMFNKYCFTIVAIWGKSYCDSAKDTVRLVYTHGISAIINDCIVSNVLSFGCLFGGLLGAAAGATAGHFIIDTTAAQLGAAILVLPAVAGFFVGFVTMAQCMMVIDAGVATIFVAFAVEPNALAQNNADLYQHFTAAQSLI